MQCSGEVSDSVSVRVSGSKERRQLAAPVMADANKRINLAAPLRSVRRHGGGAGAEVEGEEVMQSRQDGTPGGVPFRWEQRPGHPKSVRTRRATMVAAARDEEPARDKMAVVAVNAPAREEALFSDTLSVSDSCLTVNCSSATGLSDVIVRPPRVEHAGGSGVMMDRFLPAAHAVAVLSPQCSSRKASIAAATATTTALNGHGDGLPRVMPPPEPSPTSQALCIVPTEKADDANPTSLAVAVAVDNDDDGEWDTHSTRGFTSKRCGLLLPTRCMKSTLLLLNPAPAMRRRGGGWRRERSTPLLSKIGRSKSMANPLVRSARNGQHLGHDPGIMQSWEEVYINSLRRSGRGGRKGLTALLSPDLDRTVPSVRELYLEQGDGAHPKATHLGFLLIFDRSDECHDDYHCSPPESCFPVSDEPKLLPPPQISRPAPMKVFDGGKKPRRDTGDAAGGYGWPLLLEEKAAASRDIVPLLPPLPSPKSPSESWLSRALPSVSNNPPATSFLGIHVQYKRQAPAPWCSSRAPAKIVVDDHVVLGHRKLKPAPLDSET